MGFHRYTTPTYFGGLPGGYDLFNVVSGGTGAGGSAFADSAKIGGPNAGTYMVAFGEDATSSNANRGLKALAQNTDLLDDLLRRDLAIPVKTNDVTAVGSVSTIILPTNTYLGSVSYTTSVADLAKLFSITDDSDNEIINQSTGQKVQVTSVTLGAGDQIGGGGANGSFSGNTVQLNISPAIPNGQAYRVYYGSRTNLATMPNDALTTIRIRGAEEVSAPVEDLFRLLHGNNLAWNAAWTTTIYDAALSGLNDRYNRASTTNSSPPDTYFGAALNTAGAGAWVERTGPAMTVFSYDGGEAYSDPLNALYAAKHVDAIIEGSAGVSCFAAYGARVTGTALPGATGEIPAYATFLALAKNNFDSGMHATNPYTRIPKNAAVTLTAPNTDPDVGEAVVELTNAANYFRKAGTGESAISLGYDLLEIEFVVSGAAYRWFVVVVAMGSSADLTNIRKVRVRSPSGQIPAWGGLTITSATIKAWHSVTFAHGDGVNTYHSTLNGYFGTGDVKLGGLFHQAAVNFDGVSGSDIPSAPATFVGKGISGVSDDAALRWGGFQYTQPSGPNTPAYLTGEGGMYVPGASTFMDLTLPSGSTGLISGELMLSGAPGDPARFTVAVRGRIKVPAYRIGNTNLTINITETGPLIVLAKPNDVRTITIAQSADTAKEDGDTVVFWMPVPPDDPDADYWVIKREGSANNIVILNGKYSPTAGAGEARSGFCRIHLESGVWRLTGGAGIVADTDA